MDELLEILRNAGISHDVLPLGEVEVRYGGAPVVEIKRGPRGEWRVRDVVRWDEDYSGDILWDALVRLAGDAHADTSAVITARQILAALRQKTEVQEPDASAPPTDDTPTYYRAPRGTLTAADVIDAWGLDYWAGSVVAHVLRAGRKPNETKLDALRNAAGCLAHAIRVAEQEEE